MLKLKKTTDLFLSYPWQLSQYTPSMDCGMHSLWLALLRVIVSESHIHFPILANSQNYLFQSASSRWNFWPLNCSCLTLCYQGNFSTSLPGKHQMARNVLAHLCYCSFQQHSDEASLCSVYTKWRPRRGKWAETSSKVKAAEFPAGCLFRKVLFACIYVLKFHAYEILLKLQANYFLKHMFIVFKLKYNQSGKK